MPRGCSLYGSLPDQLRDPSSFASRLRHILTVRTRYRIATGVQLPALLACARRVQEILGRPLGSHTLVAGPIDWHSAARAGGPA